MNLRLHASVVRYPSICGQNRWQCEIASHTSLSRITQSFIQYMSFRTGSPCVSKPVTLQGAFTIGFPMWLPTSHLLRVPPRFIRSWGMRFPGGIPLHLTSTLIPNLGFLCASAYKNNPSPIQTKWAHDHLAFRPSINAPQSRALSRIRKDCRSRFECHLVRLTFITTRLPLIVCQEGSNQGRLQIY